MTRLFETQACAACAKGKRRCGKELPRCRRCSSSKKGIECVYPARKTACPAAGDIPNLPSASENYGDLLFATYSPPSGGQYRPSIDLDTFQPSPGIADDHPTSTWFSSQKTWEIQFPPAYANLQPAMDVKYYLKSIRGWLAAWIENGSNPFIHAHLYRTRFPRCIQDAYAALACYLHKNESNERMVYQIFEDRAKQLVSQYSTSEDDDTSTNSIPLDPIEHLARVQALLVYQIVGLYSGDIHLSYVSQTHMPVLTRWMRELVDVAKNDESLGSSVVSTSGDQTIAGFRPPYLSQGENLLWYSWILAESIRRTWIVGSSIQVLYQMLQQTETIACSGGMMFTTRKGAWEAKSAVTWEKMCSEVSVGLMHMAEADRLFTEVGPDEVNEFTKVILGLIFGLEKMERWGVPRDD